MNTEDRGKRSRRRKSNGNGTSTPQPIEVSSAAARQPASAAPAATVAAPTARAVTRQESAPRIAFELDGVQVEALPGETIWAVAERLGTHLPHLCHKPAPGYRPDGNCRACMVEIEGERVLAASC